MKITAEKYPEEVYEAIKKYGSWKNLIISGDDIAYYSIERRLTDLVAAYNEAIKTNNNFVADRCIPIMSINCKYSNHLDRNKMSDGLKSIIDTARDIVYNASKDVEEYNN